MYRCIVQLRSLDCNRAHPTLVGLEKFAVPNRCRRNQTIAGYTRTYVIPFSWRGRLDDATAENHLTVSLDPLSVVGNAQTGMILVERGRTREARQALQKALLLSTGNALAPYYLGALEAKEGQYATAIPLIERANHDAPGFPGVKGALAYAYAHVGRRVESDSILKAVRAGVTDDRSRVQLAFAEAVMGNLDAAHAVFDKLLRWDVPTVIELRADPLLAPLRADSRYPRLLARIGLRP